MNRVLRNGTCHAQPRHRASSLTPSLLRRWFESISSLGMLTLGILAFLAGPAGAQSGTVHHGRVYAEISGRQEFTGRMILRPMQPEDLRRQGMERPQIVATLQRAQEEMNRFRVLRYVPQTDETIIEVPVNRTENQVARALEATGCFQYCEPDWLVFPIGCPDDSGFGSQWHHDSSIMDSCDAWDVHTGTSSVAVAICDTGIRTTHEDFQLHRLEGYNAVDQLWETNGGDISAIHPHGTMTTGCAAANGDNSIGVAGVGWNLSHRMMRVSNSSGGGAYLSDLQHAAQTAVEAGDRVASVSYSGVDNSSNLTSATYIKSIGGLLVWAAGNDSRELTLSSRDADDILVVGATDSIDDPAWFTNYGVMVDLVAPGVSVYTTDSGSDSDYASVSGTSFSCPLTAGLYALVASASPGMTPDEIEDALKQSCDDLGTAGIDDTFGYGRINSNSALALVSGDPPTASTLR